MIKVNLNERQLKNIIKEAIKHTLKEIKQNNDNAFKIEDYIDLNSLSDEQLQSANTDLSIFLYGNGLGESIQIIDGKIKIYETSNNYTLPYEEVKEELKKKFKLDDWQIIDDIGANKVKLILVYSDIGNNSKILIEKMKLIGWYKSYITPSRLIRGIPFRAISFDPIYQESINELVRSWRFLYHISPIANKESISKNGLIPSSQNKKFDYPPKVHLLKPWHSDKQLLGVARQLYAADNSQSNDGTYCLFQVAINKIPEEVEFYFDPRYEDGVYTKQTIPSQAISKPYIFSIFNNKV